VIHWHILFRVDGRNVSVCASPSQGGNVLLSGTLEGMTKSHYQKHGFNCAAKTKKEGVLKDDCSFVDFNGNEFVWDVGFWVGA
jgi:hypothetical protein